MEDKKDKGSSKFSEFIEKLKEIVDEKADLDQNLVIDLEYVNLLKHEGESIRKVLDDLEHDAVFNEALNAIISTNNNAVEYHAAHVLLQDVIKVYNMTIAGQKEIPLKAQFVLAYFFEVLQQNDFTKSLSLARINQLVASDKFKENVQKIAQAS